MKSTSDRVPLADVRDLLHIGSPLPFKVLDAQERLLLNEGQTILDEAQFDALIDRGAWAERSLVEAERKARAAASSAPIVVQLSLFDRWERLLWQFDKLSRGLVRQEVPGSGLPAFFEALRGLIDKDADIALFLCTRQEDHRFALYPLRHAIHCAVLCTLTARQLGWDEGRIASLGLAALGMNLSILELQATMAEQEDPPSKKQLDLIRAHPDASVALLRAAGIVDEECLAIIADHHEQASGAGYPRGRTEIHECARVLRATDVYMAKISPRAKRPEILPQLAVRQLFQQNPGDPLAMAVIKTLGVHPPGSLVKLRSGEIAVSIRRPPAGTHPLVATLSDRNGKASGDTHRRNTAEPEFAVDAPMASSKEFARIMPERVYGLVSA